MLGRASVRTAFDGRQAIGTLESADDARWGTARQGEGRGRRLKRTLQALDLACLMMSWWLAYRTVLVISATDSSDRMPLFLLALIGIGSALTVMASRRLWLARVCAVRSAEIEAIGATAIISAVVVLSAGQLTDYDGHDRFALLGALYAFGLLVLTRGWFAGWLRRARRQGRFARRLVMVGTNRQADQLARLIARHPEMGYQVVGACGPRNGEACLAETVAWLGGYSDAEAAIGETNASGVLVVASALDQPELNFTLRNLLSSGCHVHVSSAMSGIAHERLLPLPLAREPLFYLERRTLTRSQLAVKRVTDVVLGGLLLAVAAPVLLLLGLAIKLQDGGPVLFSQQRIGHRGVPFTLYKLRTMVPNAEKQLARLNSRNQRVGGPLFKLASDPRVTPIGRWLRATSLDELPQLLNVLRGDMSLVGPRPALPKEVAQFDEELRQRGRMMPGITGLWQVEGRDDPSFDSYRRLDLYYVENWSIGLDLAIIGTTAGAVIRRGARILIARDGS